MRLETRTAQQLALWQGFLNITGTVISWVLVPSGLAWQQATTLAIGLGLVVAAIRFRSRWSDDVSAVAFVLGILPVAALTWGMTAYRARLGQPWCAFQEYELSCLTVATLAPPRIWAGLFGIALFAGTACVQFAMFGPAERSCVAGGAIEGVLAFGVFAVVLLFFRVRSGRVAAEATRALEEARMMKRWSRAVAAIRDLANSPLQVLTLEAEVLRQKHPEVGEHAQRIGRAMERLNELNSLLVTDSGEVSFDALGVLRDSKPEIDV
jgi:hypothetical protein